MAIGVAALAFVLLQGGGDSAVAPTGGGLPVVTQLPVESVAIDASTLPSDAPDRPATGVTDGAAPTAPAGSTRPVTSAERPTPTATADPAGTTAPSPAAPPRTSDAARFTLDSIRQAVDLATATPADARRSLAALRDLMPRLATAEDSAWGYLRQAEAHFLMEDGRSGCLTLAAALPLLRTQAQRNVHTSMSPFC